jgi:hypothetical protein
MAPTHTDRVHVGSPREDDVTSGSPSREPRSVGARARADQAHAPAAEPVRPGGSAEEMPCDRHGEHNEVRISVEEMAQHISTGRARRCPWPLAAASFEGTWFVVLHGQRDFQPASRALAALLSAADRYQAHGLACV